MAEKFPLDPIRRAIERAKAERQTRDAPRSADQPQALQDVPPAPAGPAYPKFRVRPSVLQSHRIVAHDSSFPSTIEFDLLRTKIVQHMKLKGLKTLLITSPTAGCGKTVTAINVAFSLARQSELVTVLVDLDLRKPHIADYLGIPPANDISTVIKGDTDVDGALMRVVASGTEFLLLPTIHAVSQPAETLTSLEMRSLLDRLKNIAPQSIVVIDTPPLLFADDVIALMPLVDAVLLIVAAGQSTTQEVENCRRTIPDEKFMGIVLTKASESAQSSYYGYGVSPSGGQRPQDP